MRRSLVGTSVALVVLASSCTIAPGVRATRSSAHDTAAAVVGVVEWGPCDDPSATDPELQCGTLEVPLANTFGEIRAVTRLVGHAVGE